MSGRLCPITMREHSPDASTCERCHAAVLNRAEWLKTHDNDSVRWGAWMANDSLDWAARDLLTGHASALVTS
jgi:hypothetical protein